jgi:hypothetical protein
MGTLAVMLTFFESTSAPLPALGNLAHLPSSPIGIALLLAMPLAWNPDVRGLSRLIHIVASGVFMPDWFDIGGGACMVRRRSVQPAGRLTRLRARTGGVQPAPRAGFVLRF